MPTPPGFWQCEICDEYNGVTEAKHLVWGDRASLKDPEELVSVTCLCKGSKCRSCGENLVHGSGTNTYEEATNSIGHWPNFAGMIPCDDCKARKGITW